MKRHLLITVAAAAIGAAAMLALPSVSVAQAPPMGGGYTNVIPIPVNDPSVKAIAGALFKPAGAGRPGGCLPERLCWARRSP